jgi:hypothetical protein
MTYLKTVLTFFAICAFAISMAQAQATRTWISGVGDDANPCSRTSPCKTWAGAISKTVAGGEIDALDPGGFGALTITKAITLDGGGGQVASVLVSGTNGITVSAGPNDIVMIRNIRIQGLAQTGAGGLNGIQFNSGAALHIQNCAISNFAQNGISISTSAAGVQVFIDNTTSSDNQGNGLNVTATAAYTYVSVSNSHFSNNRNGIYSADYSVTTVRNSDASGNSKGGFVASGAAGRAELNISDSTAGNNVTDGVQSGGGAAASVVRVANVSLFGNATGFSTLTNGKIDSFGNNYNLDPGGPTTKFTSE